MTFNEDVLLGVAAAYASHRISQFWLSREERYAAREEYEHEGTSDLRRTQLLARYANDIVDAPSYRFRALVKLKVKADTKATLWGVLPTLGFVVFSLLVRFVYRLITGS